jgi:Tol biopolymer transport system component
MTYPRLMKVPTDGGKSPSQVATGKYSFGPGGRYQWFYWISQPTPTLDGKSLTVVSDGPDPTLSDVVLQTLNPRNGHLTKLNVGQSFRLGQQDPTWRPDGKILAYVRNGRDGARGAPTIWRYDPKSKGSSQMTGPGYEDPAYSPDGKYVAATHTTPVGTDIVILDARTGGELLSITTDGRSWAPVWSPAGDAIAYLHLNGQIVDLKLTRVTGTGPAFTAGDTIDLTNVSGLDGASRPGWFIPSDGAPEGSPQASTGSGESSGSGTESVAPSASP